MFPIKRTSRLNVTVVTSAFTTSRIGSPTPATQRREWGHLHILYASPGRRRDDGWRIWIRMKAQLHTSDLANVQPYTGLRDLKKNFLMTTHKGL